MVRTITATSSQLWRGVDDPRRGQKTGREKRQRRGPTTREQRVHYVATPRALLILLSKFTLSQSLTLTLSIDASSLAVRLCAHLVLELISFGLQNIEIMSGSASYQQTHVPPTPDAVLIELAALLGDLLVAFAFALVEFEPARSALHRFGVQMNEFGVCACPGTISMEQP